MCVISFDGDPELVKRMFDVLLSDFAYESRRMNAGLPSQAQIAVTLPCGCNGGAMTPR